MSTSSSTVKVQLVRSPIGTKESHRATVRGLGLRKVGSIFDQIVQPVYNTGRAPHFGLRPRWNLDHDFNIEATMGICDIVEKRAQR